MKKKPVAAPGSPNAFLGELKTLKPGIDAAIEKTAPRAFSRREFDATFGKPRYAYLCGEATSSLSQPIWDLLDRGGKRWRPAFMLLVIGALGKNPSKFMEYAPIPEVVHNGSLMVDDIEDGSEMRRGKPCTHKIFGVDIAINAGNAMYYLPLLALFRNRKKLGARKLAELLEVYSQEMVNLSMGQGTDIFWHNNPSKAASEGEYLQMCAFKTGTLARMAAKMGAILAGGTPRQVDAAGKYAEAIGVAFQIQDDVLNLVANEREYGKEIGGDISEAKQTLVVIHSLAHSSVPNRFRLMQILKMHTRDPQLISEAIRLLDASGSIEFARKKARLLVEGAWRDFEKKFPRSASKEKLRAFADFLVERSL
ncbi:MAG: polyprenyl synthetase family protein [Candidatus Micrarchaeia archaeon]